MKRVQLLFVALIFLMAIGAIYSCEIHSRVPMNENALISIDDLVLWNLLTEEKSEFYLYVGSPTHPFHNEYKSNLEMAIETKHDYIFYYFNTDVNRENEFFPYLNDKLDIDVIPILMHIKNGEIIDSHGYLDGHSLEEVQYWINNR